MSDIHITCSCGKRYRTTSAMAGKQIKCPSCGCLLKIETPEEPFSTSNVAALLDEPERTSSSGSSPPESNRLEKARSRKPESAVTDDPAGDPWANFSEVDPEFEVLLPDGRVLGMSRETIRAALLKGKIDRSTRVREIDDLHKNPESVYGFVRKRPIEHPWTSVGASGAAEILGMPTLYPQIVAHDAIIKIVGTAVFVVLALVILYSVFSLDADPQRVREVLRQEHGGPWAARLLRGGALIVPEAYVFLLQVVASLLGLFFAAAIACAVGWLSGLAFGVVWYLRYRNDSGGPPPDGYPWMFWKSW